MLPPKPGKDKPSQQTISLGIYCNAAGIQSAEKQAQKLGSQLALKEFDWDEWISSDRYQSLESVQYWLDRFEEDYFNRKEKNDRTINTWETDYLGMYKRLPSFEKLSPDLLFELIFSTTPNSRQRKRACTAVSALAKFAGIEINVTPYRGNYDPIESSNRNIPTDKEIASAIASIPNPRWRYVYGLIAAYGLSNHEVFYADLESIKIPPGHLRIDYRKGKKGARIIWALYPEWWEQWELYNVQPLPDVTGKNNQILGSRVTQAFARYGLTQPYNLRHAWAIRAINFIPIEMAARMMGHSVDVHYRTYQRWITEAHQEEMYKIMMSRCDRPKPPS
jgi:integrase